MTRTRIKALPLAARTASTASEQFTEDCATGAILFFNISAASGAGGVKVQLRGYDGDGNAVLFFESGSFTSTGVRTYILNPGALSAAANGITAVSQIVLPQLFDINVVAADGSSYTYSVTLETF